MTPWLDSFAEFLVRWRWAIALVATVLGLLAWGPASQVGFDQTIERMYPPKDRTIEAFKLLKQRFGSKDAVLAVYEDPELMTNPAALARLEEVAKRLQACHGVRETFSLVDLERMLGLIEPLSTRPLVQRRETTLSQAFVKMFEGFSHGPDGKVAGVACLLETQSADGTPVSLRRAVGEIRKTLATLPDGLAPGYVAGEPVMIVEGFQLVQNDGQRLAMWSGLLLCLTMAGLFWDWKWLLVPAAMVAWTVACSLALTSMLGRSLTLVSSMLASMAMVVVAGTVSHAIVHCQRRVREGASPAEAMRGAIRQLAFPVVGALGTDAVGFASLWWSHVGPVSDFGTMMVIASGMTLLAALAFVPLAIGFRPDARRHVDTPPAPASAQPSTILSSLCRHKWLVLVATAALFALGLWGTFQMVVETDFTKNFRDDNPLVRSYQVIESRLGGAGVWDVMIPAPRAIDRRYVERVVALESRLRAMTDESTPGAGPTPVFSSVIALPDLLQAVDGDLRFKFLPMATRVESLAAAMPGPIAMLRHVPADDGSSWLRIMLRSSERRTAESKERLIRQVEQAVAEAFPGTNAEPPGVVTGFYVILSRLVSGLIADQWTMFAVALMGMFLLMFVMFRSPLAAIAAVLPNVLPVLVVSGAMGWLDIKVNMGGAMIAAVSMGLSIDGSIHFLHGFRSALSAGKSPLEALAETHRDVGWALVVATFALVAGFGTLCLSDFVPTVYFGALVSLTMIGGLFGNLVFLPAALAAIYGVGAEGAADHFPASAAG